MLKKFNCRKKFKTATHTIIHTNIPIYRHKHIPIIHSQKPVASKILTTKLNVFAHKHTFSFSLLFMEVFHLVVCHYSSDFSFILRDFILVTPVTHGTKFNVTKVNKRVFENLKQKEHGFLKLTVAEMWEYKLQCINFKLNSLKLWVFQCLHSQVSQCPPSNLFLQNAPLKLQMLALVGGKHMAPLRTFGSVQIYVQTVILINDLNC